MWYLLLLIVNLVAVLGLETKLPTSRPFLPLPGLAGLKPDSKTLRVQQFNVLADGLSGRREDLGRFSRVPKDILDWESRRESLLHEIAQYDADIITLQECDHFHDFFQPKLYERGYMGYFAPKPTSGCLDVSEYADGCALFVKKNKFRVLSCEAKSLALSIAKLKEGELDEDETSISQQNQVAIIAVLEFVEYTGGGAGESGVEKVKLSIDYDPSQYERLFQDEGSDTSWAVEGNSQPPPLIVGTAHLKSSKTSTGERYRQKGVLKILTEIERISTTLGSLGRQPAVLFTGDLNADATTSLDESRKFTMQSTYAPLTWNAIKAHRLALRSVYHDDILLFPSPVMSDEEGAGPVLPTMRPEDVYTTWKYRRSKPKTLTPRSRGTLRGANDDDERVVKRHIDYILYSPFKKGPSQAFLPTTSGPRGSINKTGTGKNAPSLVATKSDQLVISALLRLVVYTFGGIIPIVAIIDSGLTTPEKLLVSFIAVVGLLIFEASSQGTIFRPEIEEEAIIENIYNEVRPGSDIYAAQSTTGQYITESRQRGRELLREVRRFSKIIQTPGTNYGRPGLQPLTILDLYGPKDIKEGGNLLPNQAYPSDHISLAADFELKWER